MSPLVSNRGVSERLLVCKLETHLRSCGYLTARELSVGYGRADLVGFRIDADRCSVRFANQQFRALDRILHYTLLRLIPELQSGASTSLSNLSSRTGFSEAHLRRELLAYLVKWGYIVEVNAHQYAKLNGFVPLTSEIIAIEAKVSDWRKGAIQAKRYQSFAHRVFVALPSPYAHRVDRALLQAHKVGLLTVDDDGVYEELCSPVLEPRDADRHCFASEWVWRHRRDHLREIVQNVPQYPHT